ncbi:chalcone isomerase family protein [Pollutimonas sp. H1-120]|uniref:chalcone isomerase family protein n=1 Tax=Pollutimonas sp. H1-120 TaxID=3148824 RepID=UPI003B52BF14
MKYRSRFKVFLLGLLLISGVPGPAPTADAMQASGVQVPEQVSVQSHLLTLNGAGVRERFIFDVYVAALYTTIKGLDTSTIINSSEPRSLRLTLLRRLDGATLVSALNDGLKDNSTEQELRELQRPIEQFTAIVDAVDEGVPGDTIALDFNARHVTVIFNGRKLGAVESPGFMAALLRVWLGDRPAQRSLKKALLGQQ